MDKLIIAIFALWWLWLPLLFGGWSLANFIKDKIEEKKIKSFGVTEDINVVYERIKTALDIYIQQSKTSYSNLKFELFQQLPGLKDRMARNNRKRDYVRNILPYKKKKRYYKLH